MLSDTLLVRFEFWALVIVAIALPIFVVVSLLKASTISRGMLLSCSILLILLGGIDIGLLRSVMALAKETPGLLDDAVFLSEYSAALYLLPYLSAGLGVNLLTYAITYRLPVTSRRTQSENVSVRSLGAETAAAPQSAFLEAS